MEIELRNFQTTKRSFFLFGPRGTGKSTLVKQRYPDAKIIDLLDPEHYRLYRAYPERFSQFVQAHPKTSCFVIDEIQKIPELLSVVHQLIEMNSHWQFILISSNFRPLRQRGVDLLAGRAQLRSLHPFMASEIPERFDLAQHLRIGMLPLIVNSSDPKNDLKAYISLYIKEEVQLEGLIRKIEGFHQFLEIISLSQASVISYTTIARDCHTSSKTVENYIKILEDLLLSFRLRVFTKKTKRALITHNKFYFFDSGVFQSIRPKGPLDDQDSIIGHALETLVAQHLRAWIDYSTQDGELFFWRTKGGLEVDFIIYGEIGFYAIEVKKNASLKPSDLRGLKEFKKDYPQSIPILVHPRKQREIVDSILCIPTHEFLLSLKPNQKIE